VTHSPEQDVDLDGLRVFRHADWVTRFPDLVQGITARATDIEFTLSPGSSSSPDASGRGDGWTRLTRATGITSVVRCRQVHGSHVVTCPAPDSAGLRVAGDADALVTNDPGLLLAITVADCVPVFFVDPDRRTLALAHAGWRGTAAGVVDATLARMIDLGCMRSSLFVHLGPAICGKCYEVGPEVPASLGIDPPESRFVDLRRHIARHLLDSGVEPSRTSVSAGCTKCDNIHLFSFRGGDEGRRMCAFLGWRPS
jgi:YfiH family protein